AALDLILAESRCGTMSSLGSSAGNIPIPAGPPATPGKTPPFTKSFPPTSGVGPALPVPGAVTPGAPAAPSGTATPAPSAPSATQPTPPSQAGPGSGSALPATSSAPVVVPQQGPPGAPIRVVASGYGS